MTTDSRIAMSENLGLSPNLEDVLAEARRNSLTRDNPSLADLPGWFQGYRDHQRVAIREILTAYEEGAECVVLDAPTGSGKTLVGETVRRMLGVQQASYICSSKALQEQFQADYPYAKVLKGRSNYATESYPERFGGRDGLSCADCTKSPGDSNSCMWCFDTASCPYEQAKSGALRANLAVLNTSYFLSECNGPGRFSRGGLVIADECDELESELMSHVEVKISERRLKQYGLGVPRYVTKEESWREWAEEAYETVRRSPPKRLDIQNIKSIRESKRHALLVERLKSLQSGLESGGWVYTGDRSQVAFKPVTVSHLGQSKLWQHGEKWLLMSATVISADELLESLGWDEEKEWRLVKCPSTFKPENRKVVVWPVASMTWKNKDIAYPAMVEGVKEVVSRHPGDRVLVHSTSYALTNEIVQGLRRGQKGLSGSSVLPAGAEAAADPHNPHSFDPHNHPSFPQSNIHTTTVTPTLVTPRAIITYTSSQGKDAALAEYLATPGAILVAPSMDRGIDLPGDKCRVQIICKVPYLSLTDKQVSTRLYGQGLSGKRWYAVSAIRDIVQMTGRAVRSEEDWAVTYVLDRQFVDNLWSGWKRLFPEWWRESIEWRMKGLG